MQRGGGVRAHHLLQRAAPSRPPANKRQRLLAGENAMKALPQDVREAMKRFALGHQSDLDLRGVPLRNNLALALAHILDTSREKNSSSPAASGDPYSPSPLPSPFLDTKLAAELEGASAEEKPLLQTRSSSPILQHLRFGGNGFSEDGWNAMISAIGLHFGSENGCGRLLQTLELSNIGGLLGDGSASLARNLLCLYPNLRMLDLRSCALQAREGQSLALALGGEHSPADIPMWKYIQDREHKKTGQRGHLCSLNYLALDNNRLKEQGCLAIFSALASGGGHQLKWLSLSGNFMGRGKSVGQALDAFLRKHKTITALALPNNGLGNEGAKFLGQGLEQSKTIAFLDVSHNYMGGEGFGSLVHALSQSSSILALRLDGNKVGAEGGRKLASAVSSNQTLKSLSLRNCGLGEEGSTALMLAVGGATGGGSSPHPCLLSLNLAGNKIPRAGLHIEACRLMLQKCKTLCHLNLHHNQLTTSSSLLMIFGSDSTRRSAATAALSSDSGTDIEVAAASQAFVLARSTTALAVLELGSTSLVNAAALVAERSATGSSNQMKAMVSAQKETSNPQKGTYKDAVKELTSQLAWLSLGRNDLSINGATLDHVEDTFSKVFFSGQLMCLRVLDLGESYLGEKGAKSLAKSLGNSSLDTLLLPHCRLSPSGTEAILLALTSHKALTALDLSFNSAGEQGARALCFLLLSDSRKTFPSQTVPLEKKSKMSGAEGQHPRIAWINFRDNEIGRGGSAELSMALRNGANSLRELNLRNNCLGKTKRSRRVPMDSELTRTFLPTTDESDLMNIWKETFVHLRVSTRAEHWSCGVQRVDISFNGFPPDVMEAAATLSHENIAGARTCHLWQQLCPVLASFRAARGNPSWKIRESIFPLLASIAVFVGSNARPNASTAAFKDLSGVFLSRARDFRFRNNRALSPASAAPSTVTTMTPNSIGTDWLHSPFSSSVSLAATVKRSVISSPTFERYSLQDESLLPEAQNFMSSSLALSLLSTAD